MQSTNTILLVRPANFKPNTETKQSNEFQKLLSDYSESEISAKALEEFDYFVTTLQKNQINTLVFEDTISPIKPDAIFPNNWVTFHQDGHVVLYPMLAENRRQERRTDIIDALKQKFKIAGVQDFSQYEEQVQFLEGTGSIVFDHVHKIAYACLSPRTSKILFEELCSYLGYKAISFCAFSKNGKEIYHTNVMLCIGDEFAVICLDSIPNKQEKALLINSFTSTGHQIIDITLEQVNRFAGNMLQIKTLNNKKVLVCSEMAFNSLTNIQKEQLEQYCTFVSIPIHTIETIGGGSARCMMAEVFLPKQ